MQSGVRQRYFNLNPEEWSREAVDGAIVGDVVFKVQDGVRIVIFQDQSGRSDWDYYSRADRTLNAVIYGLRWEASRITGSGVVAEPTGRYNYHNWIKRHDDWTDPEHAR